MSNPFRQSTSQAKEAVLYDDLQSARSAILSRSGRNRHASARGMLSSSPGSSVGSPGEHNAIPLQEFKSPSNLPNPPIPVKISNIRRVEVETEYMQIESACGAGERSNRMLQTAPTQGAVTNSVLGNVKNALTSISSPLTRRSENSDQENLASNDGKFNYYQEARVGGSMQSGKGEECPPSMLENETNFFAQGYQPNPNLREGSTVGNIYRLYARSDRGEGDADGYKALSPVGSLVEKLLAPSTPPPMFPLPSLPGLNGLLSDHPGTLLIDSSGVFSEAGDSTVPSLPRFSPKNPFRAHSRSTCRGGSYSEDGHCVYDDHLGLRETQERKPLEKEVSEALRRASGLSFYSMGSISSSILEPGQRFLSQQVYNEVPQPMNSRPQKLEGILEAKSNANAEERNFYNQNALVPDQTTRHHHSIRVPIVHNGTYPDSPPVSPAQYLAPDFNRRSDLQDAFFLSSLTKDPAETSNVRQTSPEDDWETVGESGFGLDRGQSRDYTPAIFGSYGNYGASTIHRAGSSIANTSDAGSLSICVPEVDHFNSSTDRIAQHPAKIEYSGDYRLRELKKTNMPVLLPSYKGNKVNGYLANSSRVAPPNPAQWFRSDPKPLKKPHRHPFKTTPPEVSSPRPSMPKSDRKKANHFPRLSKAKREGNLLTSSQSRPSSWQHIMTFATGGAVPGFNEDGTRNGKSRGNAEATSEIEIEEGAEVDGDAEATTPARSLHQRLERRPLVRGPPGAFYQGLRSDGKRRVTGPHQDLKPARHPSRHGTKDYPTNELRPLSLSLRLDHPAAPHRTPSQGSNGHFYRSPLTPPQRQTWRDLYTNEQMKEIERAAEQSTSDRRRTEEWLHSSMRGSTMENMAPRKFFEAPTLCPPIRNSAQGSMSSTKNSVSMAVLFICAFFPPLLGLYVAGYLDGIMRWATGGECTTFTRRGKKGAWGLLFVWLVAGIFVLIIFVSWWFTLRKKH